MGRRAKYRGPTPRREQLTETGRRKSKNGETSHSGLSGRSTDVANTDTATLAMGSNRTETYPKRIPNLETVVGRRSNNWQTEPDVGRVADGVPSRVDRLRGLGNAVVPQVAELIGRMVIDYDTNI
jgi:site-specific DNA-cytosine methylase